MLAPQVRLIDDANPGNAIANAENSLVTYANRRMAQREQAHDLCEILVDGSRYALSCLAHNMSAEGALLETSSSVVPRRFILNNHTRNIRAVCRVMWHRGRMMGVRFVTPPRPFRR